MLAKKIKEQVKVIFFISNGKRPDIQEGKCGVMLAERL